MLICCYYSHFEIFLVSESVFRFYLCMFKTRSLKPLLQVRNSPCLIDSRVNSTFSLIINWTAYISHWCKSSTYFALQIKAILCAPTVLLLLNIILCTFQWKMCTHGYLYVMFLIILNIKLAHLYNYCAFRVMMFIIEIFTRTYVKYIINDCSERWDYYFHHATHYLFRL